MRLTTTLKIASLVLYLLLQNTVNAQNPKLRCATMDVLQKKLAASPALQQRWIQRSIELKQKTEARLNGIRTLRETDNTIVIPIVFHIVLQNPAQVTDAQIIAQLDTLNKDYAGANEDASKILTAFKPLFGKTNIQFCIAQRTPDGDPTNGIVRKTTTAGSFGTDDKMKHAETGGDDAWNTEKYYNVWICVLSNNILGYGTFPDSGDPSDDGVVIDIQALPGSNLPAYDEGKTLTHETGHYFDLLHIWGDDDGACTGSDQIGDTPNQGGPTSGSPSGVKVDNCSPTAPGIMYQNYMDYTNDDQLLLFTIDQVARIETSMTNFRSSLFNSDGCQAVVIQNLDAQLRTILLPESRVCDQEFSPQVVIRNRGSQTLTSLHIVAKLDNGDSSVLNYTQSLAHGVSDTVSLPQVSASTGIQTLTVFVTNPNEGNDQEKSNDTLQQVFQYFPPVTFVSESFEGNTFPPQGWDIVNPDKSYTWERTDTAAKTGTHSVVMRNLEYEENDKRDWLRLPDLDLNNVDSAFLSFQVAAAVQTSLTTAGNVWDTLQVMVSTDCGKTYTSLYKKWGANLVTHPTAISTPFVPTANEWRKDSVNLSDYIGAGKILVAFLNTTEFENNIYLDDVNVRSVSVNPNLKSRGYLISPNPTSGNVTLQFYPQPVNLRKIELFSMTGQLLLSIPVQEGFTSNYYNLNLSKYASGIYVVRANFTDRVVTQRVMKH